MVDASAGLPAPSIASRDPSPAGDVSTGPSVDTAPDGEGPSGVLTSAASASMPASASAGRDEESSVGAGAASDVVAPPDAMASAGVETTGEGGEDASSDAGAGLGVEAARRVSTASELASKPRSRPGFSSRTEPTSEPIDASIDISAWLPTPSVAPREASSALGVDTALDDEGPSDVLVSPGADVSPGVGTTDRADQSDISAGD
ncbi:MAG: hypothetical protein ACRCYX_14160 [Dermatophilaceae bacterium]